MSWTIREERTGDEEAIRSVVDAAFEGLPYSDGDEADMIDRLRRDGDLLLSLVAVEDGEVIGQVAYSAAGLSNGEEGWMVVGPIAVSPAHQGKGIGRALMEAGEAAMRERGAKGITVFGDPALYGRFGYRQYTPMTQAGELGEYLQVKSFGAEIPAAEIRYAPGFGFD
ncbi:GNAT family N-acetyltransferase [Aurantiacibacter gilvus]|uniref:N-acetyltransferase n=1 Tax=Aurantiacibacter gilvus TaxID=3139141 RepID=A0ABU9IIJ0_9SPHN